MSGSWNCSTTTEELKDRIPMRELLARYGVKVNRGMCSCPFHGDDKHPSMKVYPKDVHCFACGFHGDIFTVFQAFEGCDFKTAFIALGGGYEKGNDVKHSMMRNAFQRRAEERKRKEAADKAFKNRLLSAMWICDHADEIYEVFSDDWCYLVNKAEWLRWCFDRKYIEGKEINEIDVDRKCREIRRRFATV